MKKWLLSIGFVCIMVYSYAQQPVVKKVVDKDSITTLTYTINGKPSKIIRFDKDGLRHGISEEWHYDEDTPEVYHHVSLYDRGVLVEASMVAGDGIVISKNVYQDGVLTEHMIINTPKSKFPKDLYYVKLVDVGPRDCWQYNIHNGVVIDSLFVPAKR